jgi:peptide deformylase
MAVRSIVKVEDEILHKKCRKIENIDKRILQLLDDMADTLHSTSDGIGLAAPQVGVLRRAVVIDMGEGAEYYINPEITFAEGKKEGVESCLSVPLICGVVERPEKVTVKYQNRDGLVKEVTAEGLLAVCLCHEIDHLDGILYTDKATKIINQEDLGE